LSQLGSENTGGEVGEGDEKGGILILIPPSVRHWTVRWGMAVNAT